MSLKSILADQKARFKNVGAVLSTVINPFSDKKLEGKGKVGEIIAKVTSTKASKAIIAGGVLAGGAALATKAVTAGKALLSTGKTAKAANIASTASSVKGMKTIQSNPSIISGKPSGVTGGLSSPTMQTSPLSTAGMTTATAMSSPAARAGGGAVMGNMGSDTTVLGNVAESSTMRASSSRRRKAYSRKTSRKNPPKTSRRRYGTAKQYSRKGGKKVYYAKKTGQPYILLSSGKARFIKGRRKK